MSNRPIFHDATPDTFGSARTLRGRVTVAEAELWKHLRRKQLAGLRFRRQRPAGVFILDFYCHEARLGIELDGSHHDNEEQKHYDAGRDFELESRGVRVIRFKNEEVFNQPDELLRRIREIASERLNNRQRNSSL